jgi:hypothetical protein
MPEVPANYLVLGLSDSVHQLLHDGYVVAIIQMPLVGWNHDADGVTDGRRLAFLACLDVFIDDFGEHIQRHVST